MFSIIIATHDSERALVPTLAALVPGATAGIVREVIVTDAASRDETEEVADIAGCRFLASSDAARRAAEGRGRHGARRLADVLVPRPGGARHRLDRRDDGVRRAGGPTRARRSSRRPSCGRSTLRRALRAAAATPAARA